MFIAQNGHAFAKQHAEQAAMAQREDAKEKQRVTQRTERIKVLGQAETNAPAEQLGLFD